MAAVRTEARRLQEEEQQELGLLEGESGGSSLPGSAVWSRRSSALWAACGLALILASFVAAGRFRQPDQTKADGIVGLVTTEYKAGCSIKLVEGLYSVCRNTYCGQDLRLSGMPKEVRSGEECKALCDVDPECKAYEMYGQDNQCTLRPKCDFPIYSSMGTYVALKEQGQRPVEQDEGTGDEGGASPSATSPASPTPQERPTTSFSAPIGEVEPPFYDCSGASQTAAWPQAMRSWCCAHQSIGCDAVAPSPVPEDFDCDQDFAQWQLAWSGDKQAYCCERHQKGCKGAGGGDASHPQQQQQRPQPQQQQQQQLLLQQQQQQPQPSVGQLASSEVAEGRATLAASLDAGEFDCEEEVAMWKFAWSSEKQTWCCANRALGCGEEQVAGLEVAIPRQASIEETGIPVFTFSSHGQVDHIV